MYQNFATAYTQSNPGFQFNLYNASDEGPELQKWAAAYPSNTDPDFGLMQIQDAIQLGEAPTNALVDMDDFINNTIGIDKFFAPSVVDLQDRSHQENLGVPQNLGAYFLYANETILADAGQKDPTTWDEFEAVCQAVHNPSKGIYAFSTEMSDNQADLFFGPVLLSFGGQALDANNKVTFDSPETVAAVTYWEHLFSTYGPPGKETLTQVQTATMFANGQLAMDIGTNYRFAQQIYAVPATYAVTNPLAIPSGGSGDSLAPNGGTAAGIYNPCYIVSAHTTQRNDQQQVFDYIEYITAPAQASQWQAIGYIPS